MRPRPASRSVGAEAYPRGRRALHLSRLAVRDRRHGRPQDRQIAGQRDQAGAAGVGHVSLRRRTIQPVPSLCLAMTPRLSLPNVSSNSRCRRGREIGLLDHPVAGEAALERAHPLVEMGDLVGVQAGELVVAGDAELVEPGDEFGADALQPGEIVGRRRPRRGAAFDAEHLAGDVGGRGGDLVGDAVALRPVRAAASYRAAPCSPHRARRSPRRSTFGAPRPRSSRTATTSTARMATTIRMVWVSKVMAALHPRAAWAVAGRRREHPPAGDDADRHGRRQQVTRLNWMSAIIARRLTGSRPALAAAEEQPAEADAEQIGDRRRGSGSRRAAACPTAIAPPSARRTRRGSAAIRPLRPGQLAHALALEIVRPWPAKDRLARQRVAAEADADAGNVGDARSPPWPGLRARRRRPRRGRAGHGSIQPASERRGEADQEFEPGRHRRTHRPASAPPFNRAISRQPMSRRQKPAGKSIAVDGAIGGAPAPRRRSCRAR